MAPASKSSAITVTAGTVSGLDKSVYVRAQIEYDPGKDLEEARKKFGDKTIFARFKRGTIKDLQNAIRASINKHLKNGVEAEFIPAMVEEELADWRPDIKRVRGKSKIDKAFETVAGLDAESQLEFVRKLQEQIKK